ncbi:MinD/ParA family protein [Desulfobacter postgatei]|uniref:ATPase involved in chromosome partitioning n=1 Tax=Desulfobacter postgatei 2ac9 TaxID=879212 RepID=I5AZA5_9BACT|nr:MinD/ParA family protein [Desulfobacter postgatei]EIM62568.1 ATPase involved in chromosome partitioning [Desulfobacter postgatei 2ac9]MDX9964806.1 MinD/ParA family protein [Desulfobacter postgatei]
MDQAKGLRQIARTSAMQRRERNGASNGNSYPRVIAVTSGKGGVGKTNIVGNLAVAMTRLGKRVVIIDTDVGLANIDIVFNLRHKYNIRHLISGEKTLSQVMVTTNHGIGILPGGSGFADLTHFSEGEKLTLLSEFEAFSNMADIILLDTGAGISSNVLYFNASADQCLVVATTEPTSITDAYALMKVMSQNYGIKYFKLVVNMAENRTGAKKVYGSLSNALDKFLKNVVLEYCGHVPFDPALQKAVRNRSILLDMVKHSPAADAIADLAKNLLNDDRTNQNQGNLTFFMNRVFEAAQ